MDSKTWKVTVIGLCAGALSGMFGVGGGFIMVPLFVMWLGVEQRRAHGGYALHGQVDWLAVALVLSGSIFGANYGVRLLGTLPLRTIQRGFAVLLSITALRLLWSAQPHQLVTDAWGYALMVVIGIAAGVMAGLFGVGGGIVIVPALMLTVGLPAGIARGTSLAVIIGTSIAGTMAHRRRGNIDNRLAVIAGLSGIPAAAISTYVVTVVPDRIVVALFSLILLVIAARMMRSASH